MGQFDDNTESLIYDWNRADERWFPRPKVAPELNDETLRDGLQSPTATNPSLEGKFALLDLMEGLGIQTANIGLPGAGGEFHRETIALARYLADRKYKLKPNCAARTLPQDCVTILEVSERCGTQIEACLFLASSPIRRYVENWSVDQMSELVKNSVGFLCKRGVPVMFVTEDTTRASPDDLRRLFMTAIECGAQRICLADTVGHATPIGVYHLITFVKKVLADAGISHVKIDWHGHNDRNLATINSLMAAWVGADRVHGTALGIGERCGNAPIDQLLVNFKLLGWLSTDLSKLGQYCQRAAQELQLTIPSNYPVFGADAFETATGVHAAAVVKALRRDGPALADLVYSGVPASEFGRSQKIRVGPMSGRSNVIHWLETHGYEVREDVVERMFQAAKKSRKLLTDDQLRALLTERRKQRVGDGPPIPKNWEEWTSTGDLPKG